MKAKIQFIERKHWKENIPAFSLEKVFEQVAKLLSKDKFEYEFTKVPFGNSFLDLLKNLLFFKKNEADIYHITGQVHYMAFILPRKKTVLTIHDLAFLHYSKGFKSYVLKKLFLEFPVKKLKYVTTVSQTTKDAVLAQINCPPDKIRLIENPIQEHYLESEKKDFNKDCPLILQIGITPNKNIPKLIEALNGINCRLRIIGNLTKELEEQLISGGITFENAEGLSDSEMKKEFEAADFVAFCSTFEGFGLPIIEAQAMKTPVLTSDLSPMKEVSGGAAFLADPFDSSSIREGILRIINDDEFREEIIRKGTVNAKRFAPQKIAALYEKLYLEVLDEVSK